MIDENKLKELEQKINWLDHTVNSRWTIKEATVDIARVSVIGVAAVGAIAAVAGFTVLGVKESRKHAIYMTELCSKPENANNGICWGYYGEGTTKARVMPVPTPIIT